jgi:hypothetical protein
MLGSLTRTLTRLDGLGGWGARRNQGGPPAPALTASDRPGRLALVAAAALALGGLPAQAAQMAYNWSCESSPGPCASLGDPVLSFTLPETPTPTAVRATGFDIEGVRAFLSTLGNPITVTVSFAASPAAGLTVTWPSHQIGGLGGPAFSGTPDSPTLLSGVFDIRGTTVFGNFSDSVNWRVEAFLLEDPMPRIAAPPALALLAAGLAALALARPGVRRAG